MDTMIAPHGGKLVDCVVPEARRAEEAARAREMPQLELPAEAFTDAANIAEGVYSPLDGFMGKEAFESVVEAGRLPDGLAWTIPIVLPMERDQAKAVPEGPVALAREGALVGIFEVRERFTCDKRRTAMAVFGTDSTDHPGVARLLAQGDVLLAGPVRLLAPRPKVFPGVQLSPAETREVLSRRGWRTAIAFQTRNVPHAGHENLQKTVLNLFDGLMIQPVVGRKKRGDFRDEVIVRAYQALIASYFAEDRVLLNVLPLEMRYAGPREAIFHAILRKNYGCTHIVIGRDHAGVGSFYPSEAAIEIFESFPDLGIRPVTIRGDFFYCYRCGGIASERNCPHSGDDVLRFCGTDIANMIRSGQAPPAEIMRPEVYAVVAAAQQPFVE
jgi:sulfate adenylyltransferase